MTIKDHVLTSFEKSIIDAVSFVAMVGTLSNFLPHVAAIFTIVWTGIRIWESDTVRGWFGKTPIEDKPKE